VDEGLFKQKRYASGLMSMRQFIQWNLSWI